MPDKPKRIKVMMRELSPDTPVGFAQGRTVTEEDLAALRLRSVADVRRVARELLSLLEHNAGRLAELARDPEGRVLLGDLVAAIEAALSEGEREGNR